MNGNTSYLIIGSDNNQQNNPRPIEGFTSDDNEFVSYEARNSFPEKHVTQQKDVYADQFKSIWIETNDFDFVHKKSSKI